LTGVNTGEAPPEILIVTDSLSEHPVVVLVAVTVYVVVSVGLAETEAPEAVLRPVEGDHE
jgi:hypothetical protein